MFYSHEILTSQRHGVATVWLVATLGQKSTSKKVNRKAILGVDVPRACDTIMNPEAPMALRLQGNLLYGVSKVYNRQCVYTLADVQTMLDRMKTALKVVHGRGLQADAGKARPEELIVPYDPGFIPELAFPVLDFDLINPLGSTAPVVKLNSSLVSSNISISPHSQLDLNTLPQLDINSSSSIIADLGGLSFTNDSPRFAKENNDFLGDTEIGVEEGVLLQPDFDFDEDGNIVDLPMTDAPLPQAETPVRNRMSHEVVEDNAQGLQENDTIVTPLRGTARFDLQQDNDLNLGEPSPTWGRLPDPDYVDVSLEKQNATSGRKLKTQKTVQKDMITQISRDELLQWDQEYLQHMSRHNLQKAYVKSLAQAKKNAKSWITDRGIGSVGTGVGLSSVPHPLQSFCGERLFNALLDELPVTDQGRKRSSSDGSREEDLDVNGRNVRPRISDGGSEIGLSRQHGLGNQLLAQEEVELGLDAPASLPDDASSQMPWNITASLQGSVAGSSSVSRHFDSYDLVSRRFHGGLGRQSSRFPSASPLAGRGLPRDLFGRESLSSLSLNGFGDLDESGDFNDEGDSGEYARPSKYLGGDISESQATMSSLHATDRNFLDFLKTRAQNVRPAQESMGSPHAQKIPFSTMLPPMSTTRAVATQALMHVLILATKDVIQVEQKKRCRGLPYVIADLDEILLQIGD